MADYGPASRFLHRLALGNYSVARLSLKIGSGRLSREIDGGQALKVFVTGLARSGTTALTRHLATIPGFCSATYRDMPFVLMPNVWRPMNATSETASLRERKHGDGILVDFNSVEAFEEFFWKVAADDAYVGSASLSPDPIDDEKQSLFMNYVACVLQAGQDDARGFDVHPAVYLSKNNNQILRLSDLLERLERAFFIVPIRDPLAHALSLMNQHRRFAELQSRDAFVLSYMDWLGHHEFGLNAKWFDLGNTDLNNLMAQTNRESVDHWLAVWLNYYSYLATLPESDRLAVVKFDRLCRAPGAVMAGLAARMGFSGGQSTDPFEPPVYEAPPDVDADLLARCRALFDRIGSRSI